MDATKRDFLRLIAGNPPGTNRNSNPEYEAAIEVLDPHFDPNDDNPFLDAFEMLTMHAVCVTGHVRLVRIQEGAVRHVAGNRGCVSLPPLLPRRFRHNRQAFKTFTLESIIFRCKQVIRVSSGALRVLQTIFEALQDGVVSTITLDGRRMLWLQSPNGVAFGVYVMDQDASDITDSDSAGEDDDAEVFQLDDQDADDSSDEADEAVLLELVAQEEKNYDEDDDLHPEHNDFSSGEDSSDDVSDDE
jgi:hypothetical protein